MWSNRYTGQGGLRPHRASAAYGDVRPGSAPPVATSKTTLSKRQTPTERLAERREPAALHQVIDHDRHVLQIVKALRHVLADIASTLRNLQLITHRHRVSDHFDAPPVVSSVPLQRHARFIECAAREPQ